MPRSSIPSLFSRRAVLKLLTALPVFSAFGLSTHTSAADEFVEVDGWILKRSDLDRGARR
jgi:hypothetical protein